MTAWTIALLILAIAIQAADVITTIIVLKQGGQEVGFIAGPLISAGLPVWLTMVLVKSISVVFAIAAWYYSGEAALIGVLAVISALTLYAVVHNYEQMKW